MIWRVNEAPDPRARKACDTKRKETMKTILTLVEECLFFNPGQQGEKKKKTPLLFARWGKRNVSYISKANKNGSVLGDMLVWDKLPLTPWIFQVTFNWKWTIQFSGGSLLPFPLPASPTRHPQWLCLVRKKKKHTSLRVFLLMELSLHYGAINETYPSKPSAGV